MDLSDRELLGNYLLDGRCEISNNRAERQAKSYGTGRKNFLFHNSVNGAKSSAIIYSLVETAKRNGADPYYYLKYLLDELLPRLTHPFEDVSYLKNLMPWSESYKTYESEQKKADIGFRCNCQFELPPALAEGLQEAESPPGKAA